MQTNRYSNELYHYGRLGMKWGQRIFGSRADRKAARQRSKNLEKARKVSAKNRQKEAVRKQKAKDGKLPAKKMTDAELREKIERLRLEQTYNDLRKDARSNSRGTRFVDRFIDSTIDKVAENAGADVVAQSIKVLTVRGANKMFGSEEVFTNNKRK